MDKFSHGNFGHWMLVPNIAKVKFSMPVSLNYCPKFGRSHSKIEKLIWSRDHPNNVLFV